MSDTEASPTQNRNRETLHIDDYNFQEREPKCINSLCNLINSRLKILENEIVAQHKVWESIQREVDEVKSLIEDCTSTCGSSSSSAQENESENVDSALESHKTCNSLYWGKIKQAEENVEEKKSLMRILSNDVTKLKNSKKKCNRRHPKTKSNIDLILDVTNGLHVLKCEDCKFCSEHLDFREGLLSAVIELIHFTEKNYSNSLDENKALKACLQKIYVKTKSCLLHSQIYLKSTQNHPPFDTENHTVCVDNIYTSFEEFCQHFQNLQDELLQLRQILLAAEENHLDELFQDSHSSNCICYNFMKKGDAHSSNSSDKNEAKYSKSSQKNLSIYEKKLKTLTYCDEPDEDPDAIFDSDQIFKLNENDASKQLENLRGRIYEAVRTIRDVEVEENDDGNLINMVTSLSEECSALRQEVSYLRNVRQEKKRSWNKLQCFIMDAERKLKGDRSISSMKEVIKDLSQIISSSESSSLDETILYMYSNQLEWMEKYSAISENPPEETEASHECGSKSKAASTNASTQTMRYFSPENSAKEFHSERDIETCDIGIQVEGVFDYYSSEACKPFQSSFSEINREIYVVPEVMEENDACYSSVNLENKSNDSLELSNSKSSYPDVAGKTSELCEELAVSSESNSVPFENACQSIVASSGTFPFETNFGKLVPHKSSKKFTLPLLNISDISFDSNKVGFWNLFPDTNHKFNSPINNTMYIYMFLSQNADIFHKFNNMFYNMRGNLKSVEISDGGNNWSCIILESDDSPLPLNASKPSVKYLPYQTTLVEDKSNEELPEESKILSCNDIVESNVICREVIFNTSGSSFPVLSSNSSDETLMPNTSPSDFHTVNDNIHLSSSSLSEAAMEALEEQIIPDSAESNVELPVDTDGHKIFEEKDSSVERPAPACREGTFIIESSDTLGLRKQTMFDENMYYTAILTTLVSSGVNTSEKNYVLFEVCNTLKHSAAEEFQCDDQLPATNLAEKHNVQHFVLCETGYEDKTKRHQAVSDICHIIFCKSNASLENKGLFDISYGNNASFNPLVPQYLPLETFNYDSFEPLSLTHNCEIYMCNSKNDSKMSNEEENSIFIPKNYLRFKTSLPDKDISQYGVLDTSMQNHYITTGYTEPFALNCIELPSNNEVENLNGKKSDSIVEVISERKSMWSQTDDSYKLILQNEMLENLSENCETPMNDEEFAHELAIDEVENCDDGPSINELNHSDDMLKCVTPQPEHVLSEICLLDEIKALKENLGHQNAVLQRLKEELEDSNLKLEEKESRLQMLQMEHSRLNEIIIQQNIKEVEDKKSQTESLDGGERYEDLRKEVHSLRQENMTHNEKILHQNKTIQHVKAQLCSSISHLKTLKDSATKQLKKQKHQILKSLKIKQQLQETKIVLEKKCEEVEKKNEVISDQEFQLHEIQARLDTTLEELNQKSKEFPVRSTISIKVDNESQTLISTEKERKEDKKLLPVTEQDVMLKKHSEELMELQTKLQHLESIFSNKKEYNRLVSPEENLNRTSNELKVPSHLKEGNIWKLLMISEQSYLSLLSKLSDSLQISDLKGSVTLMHTSWLNSDELADARRQDHKKILQSLDKLKRSIRYLQETHHQEHRRQNAESAGSDEKKSSFMCHSDEMHFQYLCEVLQKAQENLMKEYSQKKTSHQRSIVTTGSLRTNRHANSRERRIPLELKNGKILALLDDKVSHKDLLPNKHEFNKMDSKAGTSSFKSKSSS